MIVAQYLVMEISSRQQMVFLHEPAVNLPSESKIIVVINFLLRIDDVLYSEFLNSVNQGLIYIFLNFTSKIVIVRRMWSVGPSFYVLQRLYG